MCIRDRVERLSELLDFAVGSIHLESRRERAVGDQRGREGDLLERANGPARDPDAAAHAHDRGEERPETEHECQQAQGLFQVCLLYTSVGDVRGRARVSDAEDKRLPPAGFRQRGPKPTGTRLMLIRHGESYANANGLAGGPLGDGGLTPLGCRQAQALADRLTSSNELSSATRCV